VNGLRTFWRLIHEPYVNPFDIEVRGFPLLRLVRQYYLRYHWRDLLVIFIIGSLTGLMAYVYAAAGRFIVDDVVELAAPEQKLAGHEAFDPSRPGEDLLFVSPEPRHRTALVQQHLDPYVSPEPRQRTSWVQRHDERRGRSTQERLKLLGWIALALISLELLRQLASCVMFERIVRVTQGVQFRMSQHIYRKLHALQLEYHDTHAPGRLLTCLFGDVPSMARNLDLLIRGIPRNLFAIIVGAVIVMWIDPTLGAIVLVSLPAYGVSYLWFGKLFRNVNWNTRARAGELDALLSNRVSNFMIVKAFGRESGEVAQLLRQEKELIRRRLATAVLRTMYTALCGVFTGVCITAVLWLGALRVRDGQMTAGELLMFYATAAYLFEPLGWFIRWAAVIYGLRVMAVKMLEVLEAPISISDPPTPTALPDLPCDIRFDHVTMTYGDTDRKVLSDVSFTVPGGAKLCIMGPSGSGKSTLAKLAARLYDPTEGTVLMGGTDAKRFKIADLRRLVGFVNQEPIIFRGTIADNIAYGRAAAESGQVTAAAKHAQIHDFVDRLPDRYDAATQERGKNLSGGQKQRINLARALYREPQVLIMDDCTSALDVETEARLVEAFRTVLNERTCILVSQRVSIALQCELVMMLADGKIVDFGPPSELLRTDGAFAAVVREHARKARGVEIE
jgi:ATP-binding cassette subfamily B protein